MKRITGLLLMVSSLVALSCSAEAEAPQSQGVGDDTAPASSTLALEAAGTSISSKRDPSRHWQEYAQAYKRSAAASRSAAAAAAAAPTVLESKVPTTSANFSSVPVWGDAEIKMQFRALRDIRFQYGSESPSFERRCSWLFPDYGCEARAELVASMAGDNGLTKPYKLFSFGDLQVSTANSPYGVVFWWYHVAPVVKSAASGTVYVLDPALEPTRPLEWQQWLLLQVAVLGDVQVTVADSNAYDPYEPVTGAANQRALALYKQASVHLNDEYNRQLELYREPDEVLGNNPPWPKEKSYYFGEPFIMVPACRTCSGTDALSLRCALDCP
ncbi:MAG TPA: protein-glutamine glutaminase family protein [Polyangiaceae bacterium]|nr:protein-glutamine glutaminase family protein [Polyangiaceae bacterium]